MATRDTQRKRVYRAESLVPRGQEFESLQVMRAYAVTVMRSDWWTLNSSIRAVTIVERNHSRGKAWWHKSLITMPPFAWYERYLIHEMAHIAHGVPHWHEAGHGPRYVRIYHNMIEYFMGADAASAFRRGCLRQGIAAGLPVVMHEHIHPTAANRWYEASYRRYRMGLRTTPPALRKGMNQQQARAIRSRVDLEYEQGAAGNDVA